VHKKKEGARGSGRAPPLPVTHVSLGCSHPELGIPTCVGKTLQTFSTTYRMLVHPHVRGADVHEPNGAILQRTTRR